MSRPICFDAPDALSVQDRQLLEKYFEKNNVERVVNALYPCCLHSVAVQIQSFPVKFFEATKSNLHAVEMPRSLLAAQPIKLH